MCPHCRQNAPLVYRGISAFCTACGAPRMPLANASVNLAGQTSKVGGTVARVFGWLVLAGGLLLALFVAGIMAIVSAPGAWILGINGSIALVTMIAAWAILRGGKALTKSGETEELAMKNQAIFALANTRNGILRPWDVAQALQVTPKEADDILTKLAKEQSDHVTIDVDSEGNVLYRFIAVDWNVRQARAVAPTMAPNAVPPNVRLKVPPVQARVASPQANLRVDAKDTSAASREALEDEFAAMEAEAEQAAQKTR